MTDIVAAIAQTVHTMVADVAEQQPGDPHRSRQLAAELDTHLEAVEPLVDAVNNLIDADTIAAAEAEQLTDQLRSLGRQLQDAYATQLQPSEHRVAAARAVALATRLQAVAARIN